MWWADIKKEKVVNSGGIEQVMKGIGEDGCKYAGVSEAKSSKKKVKKEAFKKTETGTEIKAKWEN